MATPDPKSNPAPQPRPKIPAPGTLPKLPQTFFNMEKRADSKKPTKR
jgi:hypothetical protein